VDAEGGAHIADLTGSRAGMSREEVVENMPGPA
jgi:hypothetical protein